MKKWISLFSLNDKDWLQDELNGFISKYDVHEIEVWTDGNWNAKVIYSYSEQNDDSIMNEYLEKEGVEDERSS